MATTKSGDMRHDKTNPNIRRYMFLYPKHEPSLFAITSDHIRIQRSKVRNDKGQNKYIVTLPGGGQYVKEFVWLPRFFEWFEREVAPFKLSKFNGEGAFSKTSPGEKDRMILLRREGLTYAKIALELKRSETTVANFCRAWERENGVKLKKKRAA